MTRVWLMPLVLLLLLQVVIFVEASISQGSILAQDVNFWRLREHHGVRFEVEEQHPLLRIQRDSAQSPFEVSRSRSKEFPDKWFEQPLDHFSKGEGTFQQRYWVNGRHYKTGGPVIVLDGGETSGKNRIPFLDTGIVEILAKATNGLGIVLEHRYYGKSIPVYNFSTDSMRWLNNAQSAADSANFMANVKFEGIDSDLTAPGTPWIYYGGSYAGARAAHMRVLYPELVFGAIASSGVTHATLANWEYMEIIRNAADPTCSKNLESAIAAIDDMLAMPLLRNRLKALFGLADLEHDDDFAALLERPLGAWQAKNWDPAVGSTRFDEFCDALAKPLIGSATSTLPGGVKVPLTVYNYAQYIRENYVSKCPEELTVEECFGTYDASKFRDTSLSQHWRGWIFQVCTEWGYFTSAPPDQSHPRIVSRLLTLEISSRICPLAFPPGTHFSVPSLPNITAVNALGDFDIAADRLAIIDGEVDPWRPATPHSDYASDRKDTILRPFKLIPNGVHHYDEYGLRKLRDEPLEIQKIHEEMIYFVKEWLKDRDSSNMTR
ncbi:peptidase S28 [Rickenella mellea]|uniref:Peptidase S28 n=1 Tax=Rickenella mellea TaxID=50990 RepID=A0A4Y7Q3D4_9AGAM|nr:peptidase S28 [Rickenella mellea]